MMLGDEQRLGCDGCVCALAMQSGTAQCCSVCFGRILEARLQAVSATSFVACDPSQVHAGLQVALMQHIHCLAPCFTPWYAQPING